MTQRSQTADEASTPHLFTVEEYMTLAIPGRTELIEGVIYDVAAKHEPPYRSVIGPLSETSAANCAATGNDSPRRHFTKRGNAPVCLFNKRQHDRL